MKDMAEWVIAVEASRLYDKASRIFADDPEFYELLRDLSDDEKSHREIIRSVYELSRHRKLDPCPVTFDEMTRHLESLIELCDEKLDSGMIKKPDLIEAMIYLEFSEMNDLFLYVLSLLKPRSKEHARALAEVKKHKRSIVRFVESRPEYAGFLKLIRRGSSIKIQAE